MNPKGGVGKSTLAINLATEYASRGNSVVILDCDDPQFTCLDWERQRNNRDEEDLTEVGLYTAEDVEEIEVALDGLKGQGVDLVILDGPGRMGEITGYILRRSDTILVPVTPSATDVWGARPLVDLIREYELESRSWFIATQVDTQTAIYDHFDFLLDREEYPFSLLEAAVRKRPATYPETPFDGLGVSEKKPGGAAHKEIEALADEIVEVSTRAPVTS